jgi:mediator of RNA polymerase II transcription subunit 12, fungi type
MDWLVSSLENSPRAKLPMWLLITQVYWKDLLKYRKYGRRLSAALLNQLAEVMWSLILRFCIYSHSYRH